jgi:hypothetical protein
LVGIKKYIIIYFTNAGSVPQVDDPERGHKGRLHHTETGKVAFLISNNNVKGHFKRKRRWGQKYYQLIGIALVSRGWDLFFFILLRRHLSPLEIYFRLILSVKSRICRHTNKRNAALWCKKMKNPQYFFNRRHEFVQYRMRLCGVKK